jgi:hypothetical protein
MKSNFIPQAKMKQEEPWQVVFERNKIYNLSKKQSFRHFKKTNPEFIQVNIWSSVWFQVLVLLVSFGAVWILATVLNPSLKSWSFSTPAEQSRLASSIQSDRSTSTETARYSSSQSYTSNQNEQTTTASSTNSYEDNTISPNSSLTSSSSSTYSGKTSADSKTLKESTLSTSTITTNTSTADKTVNTTPTTSTTNKPVVTSTTNITKTVDSPIKDLTARIFVYDKASRRPLSEVCINGLYRASSAGNSGLYVLLSGSHRLAVFSNGMCQTESTISFELLSGETKTLYLSAPISRPTPNPKVN